MIGTLTVGRPTLTTLRVAQRQDAQAVLSLIAADDALAEHPIAQQPWENGQTTAIGNARLMAIKKQMFRNLSKR